MAANEIPQTGHIKGSGAEELRNMRLWQLTATPGSPTEGIFWFNSTVGNKRIYFYDAVAAAAIAVPRLDRAESVTAQWGFAPASAQAPFTLNANAQGQLVTGLNADQLEGKEPSATATVDTIALRDASGRLEVGLASAGDDAVNVTYLDAYNFAASRITSGQLALARGGTAADLSAAATGGLIWKDTSALAATAALTGVLIGNGAAAPSALAQLTVALGGTGAATAADARTNLDVMWIDEVRAGFGRPFGGLALTSTDAIDGTSGINLGLNDFTCSVILTADDYSNVTYSLFGSHRTGSNDFIFKISFTGGFVLEFHTTTYSLTPDIALVDGATYQLTVTCDRDGLATLYINGISDRDKNSTAVTVSIAASSAIDVGSGNADVYRVGRRGGDATPTQHTVFRAVRVFNRILTAAEVLQLTTEGNVPADLQSLLLLDLDLENADPAISTTVKDRSTSNNHGTTSGSTYQVNRKRQVNTETAVVSGLTANNVLYAGTGGVLTGLAVNSSGIKFLSQTSSAAPVWTDLFGGTNTWSGNNTFSNPVTVATPTSGSHAATRDYVDSAVTSGLRVLESCAVRTTANITLSGEQTIDGVLTSASRVLVANQTAPAENGIYVSAAGAWSRATDANTAAEITAGAYTFVTSGTAYAGTSWTQTQTVTTLGTDAISWQLFFQQADYVEGSGIDITGLTISVDVTATFSWTGVHTFTNSGGARLNPYGASAGNTTSLRFYELAANGTNYVGFKAPDSLTADVTWVLPSADGSANYYLKTNGSGTLSFAQIASTEINNSTFVTTVSGTLNRISVSGTLTPTIDIDAAYVGQATITTLGTVTTGTWSATTIAVNKGGTGLTSYSTGDILYASGATTLSKLAIEAAGAYLRSDGSGPTWSAYSLPSAVAVNQLLYGSSTSAVSALATVASRVLTTDGSGNLGWTATLPSGLSVAGATDSKVAKIRWYNVGDGSSTSITLTHSYGTRDVVVQVVEAASEYKTVQCAVARTDTNTVTIEFLTAPSTNQYRAAVIAAI